MLDKLGIADYDKVGNLDKLVFTMADAIREARFTWKTISKQMSWTLIFTATRTTHTI